MIGYRTEELYGSGNRKAANVLAFEIFQLSNVDILLTIANTILKNNKIADDLIYLADCINEKVDDDVVEKFLNNAFNNEELGIEFCQNILDEINKVLGKEINYVLWLSDTVEELLKEYYLNDDVLLDSYECSDIILSDLGDNGKLYGYTECPKPILK